MTCSRCGFEGHNSRTCPGPHRECATCGKPTANMNDPSERHDSAYCSAYTSPSCWGNPGFFHDGRWVSMSEVQPIGPISEEQDLRTAGELSTALVEYMPSQPARSPSR